MPPGRSVPAGPLSTEQWIDALLDRHMRGFTTSEFLKAVRALSVRYVERRAELPHRSPIDSAGKRAAFAGFFAPLHHLTARSVATAVGAGDRPLEHIVDLGCGTGAAGSAWGTTLPTRPVLTGVDQTPWVLEEARWNWDVLGFSSTTKRHDFVEFAWGGRDTRGSTRGATGIVLGWSANELAHEGRGRLLPRLLKAHELGASILVIEPLARSAAKWWNSWVQPVVEAGGRADDWKFPANLPPRLAELDSQAGFRREHLSARSLWLPAGDPPS